jgi:hypothetical protein
MDELAARFRRLAAGRAGLRYSAELRGVAVEYSRQSVALGRSRRQTASDLGLGEWTLSRWLRRGKEPRRKAVVPVHEVRVVEPLVPGGPVLMLGSGVRVEGLSVSALVAVLKELS